MHYHIAKNPDYCSRGGFPVWNVDRYFAVLPEVTGQELTTSTFQCAVENSLLVVKPVAGKATEVLVNNNGRRRDLTPRQLVDFLTTCGKKGDSVSIDDTVTSTYFGQAIEKELVRVFGEDGYLLTSGRIPDLDYLRKVLPAQASMALMQKAPVTQQLPRR